MVDYDKSTGTAGTLRVRDTGSDVEFWLGCSDPATNSGGIPWDGYVNGVIVGGSFPWAAGGGFRRVATYSVSSSQTVDFNIGATGTMGFSGPTGFSVGISRGSVPPAPTPLEFQNITATAMRARFSGNGNGGAPLLRWESQYSTSPTFASGNSGLIVSGGTVDQDGLTPGTTYYWRHRGVNTLGNGAWSAVTSATTLAGGRIKHDGSWVDAVPWEKVGGSWVRSRVFEKQGGSWSLVR